MRFCINTDAEAENIKTNSASESFLLLLWLQSGNFGTKNIMKYSQNFTFVLVFENINIAADMFGSILCHTEFTALKQNHKHYGNPSYMWLSSFY